MYAAGYVLSTCAIGKRREGKRRCQKKHSVEELREIIRKSEEELLGENIDSHRRKLLTTNIRRCRIKLIQRKGEELILEKKAKKNGKDELIEREV